MFTESSLPEYCCMEGWTGGGTENFDLDPMFQKPEIGEFHLQTGSPCIDTGVTIPEITRDNEGKARPCSGITGECGPWYPFDIGAYEYTPPTVVEILLWRRWFSETEGRDLDYNGDGVLDVADIVTRLSNPPSVAAPIDAIVGK